MFTLGTIRTFRTANFRVIVDAIACDSLDLSWDETGEVREKINNGELLAFDVRARVVHDDLGEIASDYLGGCIYESLEAFMDHKECAAQTRKLRAEGSNAVVGSYFSDMVRNVCRDARKRLAELRDGLNGLHVRA